MLTKFLIAGAVALGTGLIGSADPSSLTSTTKTAVAGPYYGYGGYGFAPRAFHYGGFGPRYGIGPRIYPGFYHPRRAFVGRGFVGRRFGYPGVGFRRGFGYRGFGGGGVFVGGRRGFVSVGF